MLQFVIYIIVSESLIFNNANEAARSMCKEGEEPTKRYIVLYITFVFTFGF